ncbi:MAG: MaoC/PaaZ C-terminal domain-containing protein [Candidatus Limnocylindria bacterium]
MTWRFEDAVPGSTIAHPRGRTITPDEHARLAWLTDNASAVHGDAHRAAAGPFGQVVVLGALTVAIVLGLAEPVVAEPALAGRAAPTGWRRIALTATVVGGDTLSAVSRIHAVRPDADGRGGRVRRTVEGLDQHGRVVARIEEERWAPASR